MIVCRYGNCDYKEFEQIRDGIFVNGNHAMGLLGASYSPNLQTAIFSFVSAEYVPESLDKTTKHYYPKVEIEKLLALEPTEEKIDASSYPPTKIE